MNGLRAALFTVIATAGLLAGSGCATTADDKARGAQSVQPSAATSSSEAARTRARPPRSVDEATPLPQRAYEVVSRFPWVEGGVGSSILAVDSRGTLLLAQAEEKEGLELSDPSLALRTGSGRDKVFAAVPKPPQLTQVMAGTLNDKYVVWMETPSVETGVQPWKLYAYDRATGAVRRLATAPRVGRSLPPSVPGYTGPVLAGGRVYWAQVGGRPGAESVDVMGCVIARCAPRVAIAGAALPAAAGKKVYAIAAQRFTGVRGPGATLTIRSLNVRNGRISDVKTIPATESQFPTGLAASTSRLLWTLTDSVDKDSATVWNSETGEEVVISSELRGMFGFPVLTETYAAWAESSGLTRVGNYVFDVQSEKLHSFGVGGYYGVYGAGDMLAWREPQRSGKPSSAVPGVDHIVVRLR